MKKILFAVLIMSLGLLTACGEKESPVVDIEGEAIILDEEPLEKPDVQEQEETAKSTEMILITDREEVDGKMQSYLTGEWKDAEVVQRRSIGVMMPNNEPAIPHYGISMASIVYEAPAESWSCTRFMAMYEDYDDMDMIGPVRSARDYYMYESMAYDSIFVNWGLAVPYAGPLFDAKRLDHISNALSGQSNAYGNAFFRNEDRENAGYDTEFTGYFDVSKVDDAIRAKGYEAEYTDRFVQAFTFADSEIGARAEYADCEDATLIYPNDPDNSKKNGYQEAAPYFEYDEEEQVYYRYQHGGPMMDEYNDKQVSVSNIVFKICGGEVRDDHGYLAFGVHGTGKAYVFTNGKVIEGTWQRNSDYEPNMFFDKDGNEIIFNQGKTWICNIPYSDKNNVKTNFTWE